MKIIKSIFKFVSLVLPALFLFGLISDIVKGKSEAIEIAVRVLILILISILAYCAICVSKKNVLKWAARFCFISLSISVIIAISGIVFEAQTGKFFNFMAFLGWASVFLVYYVLLRERLHAENV